MINLLRKALFLAIAMFTFSTLAEVNYPIIPKPVKLVPAKGYFRLKKITTISTGNSTESAKLLIKQLQATTGFPLKTVESGGDIKFQISDTLKGKSPDAYSIKVNRDRIIISGASESGLFYGGQSLLQLLPSQIYGNVKTSGFKWMIPCVYIEDYPRFKWRGMHLDVARHFMPKEFIKKFIDQLAAVKMNNLHLHLTEDQGWRIEIKKYPKLTEVGSTRKQTMLHPEYRVPGGPNYDGKPHGGFYTQEDLKELVKYAADRHVNIMPEIELPGHSQAALTAYPEFGCTGEKLELKCEPGVSPHLYNIDEKTFKFLEDIITEVMEIFPSVYFHIGGDEAPKGQWKNSKLAQAKIKELGLKDEQELQSWFIDRIGKFLKKNGRHLVGWQEIMHGGTPEGAVVMPWMGIQAGFEAANAGHDVVIATTYPNYFDSKQTKDPTEPPALMNGPFPLSMVYNQKFDFKQIKPEKQHHVIGAQGQLWTEYMPTPEVVEYQAFPRVIALAEAVWSPLEQKNYNDFLKRLVYHGKRMTEQKVNFHFLDPLPSCEWNPEKVKKGYVEFEFKSDGSDDELLVEFNFTGGKNALTISGVELFNGPKEVSKDRHYSYVGRTAYRNLYSLKLPNKKNKTYKIKAYIKGIDGSNSHGEVKVYQGRNSWKFRPQRVKQGNLPIGYWDSISSASKSALTVDATGLLKRSGKHLVKLTHTDGTDALNVKGVVLYQNGKKVSADMHKGVAGNKSSKNLYRIDVPNHRAKCVIKIILAKPVKMTNGYIYANAINILQRKGDKLGAPVAVWAPENLLGDFSEVEFDVTKLVSKPGLYEVEFAYSGGGNGLEIKEITLWNADNAVVSDKHEGFTGGRSKNNRYSLKIEKLSKGSKIIKAMIKGGGGKDSFGEIIIRKK